MKKISVIFKFIFAFGLIVFFNLTTKAQIGKFYSSNIDLSNSLINKVFQDDRGFVWIATEDGLNKFDGNKFIIYRHNHNDSTSLLNNYVKTIFQDSQERLWIVCITGIQCYDLATDCFVTYPIKHTNSSILPQATPFIIELKDHRIWISTFGQGIIELKNESFIPNIKINDLTKSYFVNLIYEDSKQNVWIATQDKGLFLYSTTDDNIKNISNIFPSNPEDISSICEDKNGQIYLSTLNNGLLKYSYTTNSFEKIEDEYNGLLSIKTLMIDNDNTLYIGTEGNGLKILQNTSNHIEDYNYTFETFDQSATKVHSILKDKDNNLWLGLFQKGLMMIPSIKYNFDYYGYKSFMKNNIGSSCIMTICVDNNQTTWVGTDNDGIYALDKNGKQINHYKKGLKGNVPPNVMYIFQDSQHKLWLGSYFSGLLLMNPQNGQCTPINMVNEAEKVYNITEDDNHNIWVSTYGYGIFKLDLSGKILNRYHSSQLHAGQNDRKANQLCHDWVNCIYKDSDSLLWIGTWGGLSCLNPQNDNFLNYLSSNNLLPTDVFVHCISEDSKGNIWIGSAFGLYKFEKTNQKMTLYTTQDGLPSDVICGIEEDGQGCLWISTHFGISKYNPTTNNFVNYFATDGLQGNEFTRGAFFKTKDGKIYFGGINGITGFYPQNIIERKKTLRIEITHFYLGNHLVNTNDLAGNKPIIKTNIMDAQSINLENTQNSFSIEFSTMDFLNPERIIYEYQIPELDKKWRSTRSGMNKISYSNLSPGNYTFQVRAKDNDSYSNIRTLHIHIAQPWMLSGWAIILWTVLFLLFIYFISTYIISKIRRKQRQIIQRQKEQINEAKLQFFTNMSHEIRTPMTLIINPLEELIAEKDEKQAVYLMIHRNAKRILRVINQMMDIRKLDNGQMKLKFRETNIVGFIEDLMLTFEYTAKQKNIKFHFNNESSINDLKVWIDLNNFDKILANILSNAFKFTSEGGTITVTLKIGENKDRPDALSYYFEINVSDTGIGIAPEKMEHIFDRFYQIDNDLTQSNFGNGIGLNLAKQLTLLHHGEIMVKNNIDGPGTTFTIRVPLGKKHLRQDEIENLKFSKETTQSIINKEIEGINIEKNENIDKRELTKTKYHILIIEDDFEIRQYIRKELKKDFRITECSDGSEGLETVLKTRPDLIISDIMMPKLDGYTLCKKIKHNSNISSIPIILLTAKVTSEDKLAGLEVGADAYITKPFNMEILRTTVNNLIKNREIVVKNISNKEHTDNQISAINIQMKSSDEALINRIMNIITEHLDDPKLSVESLAQMAGMSRVHIYRRIKDLTGMSASDYIKTIRLKKAAQLLTEKGPNVSEVAYATGFSSLSHFSSSFREFYGMSPTEYKETNSQK